MTTPNIDAANSPTSSAAYYAMWQAGELPIEEALSVMYGDLLLLSDALALMRSQHATLVKHVAHMLEQAGGSVDVPGIGTISTISFYR